MMTKIPSTIKTKITKMFKKGCSIDEIKAAVIPDFPKITPDRIKTVVKTHLRKAADNLWSKAVKQLAGNKCAVCGKMGANDAHHLIGRVHTLYRWDIDNGVCLCAYHHTLGHDIAAHGSTDVTERFAVFMKEHRLEQWRNFERNKDLKAIVKVDIFALLEIVKGLENQVEG